MQDEFLKLLSPRRGHFQYESGHHGDLWLDLDSLYLRPSRLRPFVEQLAAALSKHNIDAVCGPMTGGAFLAQMIADFLDVEFFYTERFVTEKQTLYPVSYLLPASVCKSVAGKRMAIVDDVINACSAVGGTFTELQTHGATPIAIGAFLTLGPTPAKFARDRNVALETIAQAPNNLWLPTECPLCAAKMPLNPPVE